MQTIKDIEPLVNLLESKDDKVRRSARKSLVLIRKPSAASLSEVLQKSNSTVYCQIFEKPLNLPFLKVPPWLHLKFWKKLARKQNIKSSLNEKKINETNML